MNKHFYTVVIFIVLFASILAAGLNISRVAAQPVVDGTITPGEYAGGMAVTLVGPYPAAAPFPPQTVDAYIEWDSQYLYVAVNEPVPTLGGGTNDWIEFAFDAGPHRPFLDAFVLFGSGQLQYVKCPKPPGGWGWDTWPHTWWAITGASATEFKFDYTDFGITFGDTIKMVIDRGRDAGSYPPLGDCVTWPFTAKYYPPQGIDPTTWGDVGLNGGPPPPPPTHVVDGVIGSVEYAGGMSVLLVGRTDSSWTVDAYIDWDTEYLYVAVDEPVPGYPTGGGLDWIEFAFDAGPGRPFYDGFALFGDGHSHHTECPKPPGSWGIVPYSFLSASGTATEFRVDYTDFGIALGDTIKMAIDRNNGSAVPPPPLYMYGFAAFWPEGADVYGSGPDVTTWGDVTLSAHYTLTVNIVGSGSVTKSPDQPTYTHGTVVQLTATADPGWTFSSSWIGDLTGPTNPDYITMDGDKTVTAIFTQDTVSLTVVSAYDSPNPSGTTSYTPGTSVTASVTSPVAGPTGYRYVCTGWTGTGDVSSSGTGTTVTFTINQDSGITWTWKTQSYLTVKTDPPGIATIPGEGWYDKSTTVTLTAPDVPGYVFTYWDFNGISQGNGVNPITVQIDCIATAHYTACPPVECEVTFLIYPDCPKNITFLGKTYLNGSTDSFAFGTSGLATANAPTGYVFDHWEVTGNVAVSDPDVNPTTVTVCCGGTLKAVFTQAECQVTFFTDPVCSGFNITFEGGTYHNDTTDSFAFGTSGLATANAPTGYVFDHWEVTGNVAVSSTTENPTCVTITCGGTLKAVFSQAECTAPHAAFTYSPLDPEVGEEVVFDASESTPDGGSIISYEWDFGDGNITTVTDPIITHVYCETCFHTVILNVTNCCGKWDTESKTIKVSPDPPPPMNPTALFTRTPLEPYIGQNVTFDASSSYDPDGYIVSYTWDFGDGNITKVFDSVITHDYAAAGTYDVALTVTDNHGLTDSARNSLSIRTRLGDLNDDGIVDIFDVVTVSVAFGSEPGDPNWNQAADLTNGFGDGVGDGIVDIFDVVAVVKEFGKTAL